MAYGRLLVSAQERRWTEKELGSLGLSFWKIWGSHSPATIQKLCTVIRHMCDFTTVVENYIDGRWVSRMPAELTDQRNYVQHSLISLETGAEIEKGGERLTEPHYESCRLACIAYSFLVIFPFPPIVGLFERLTARLQKAMMNIRLRLDELSRPRLELHLWIAVMGAIICVGLPDRAFYIREITKILPQLQVDSYEGLVRILQTFLWHPKTNNYDGMDLWRALKPPAPKRPP